MEQGDIFPTGNDRRLLFSLEEFRNIFLTALRQNVDQNRHDNLGDHNLNPGMFPPEFTKSAAVLVPVIGREQEPTILLTKRSDDLNHHAGQVSFPGGRHEESDLNMIDTALRETEEEIGLDRDAVEVIGELPTYETRTGFSVKPIVGLIKPPIELNIDSKEVADVFEIPLSFVLDRKNHERHSREWQNTMRNFYVFPHPKYYIWGATAGMLVNLAELILSVDGTSNNGY